MYLRKDVIAALFFVAGIAPSLAQQVVDPLQKDRDAVKHNLDIMSAYAAQLATENTELKKKIADMEEATKPKEDEKK